MSRNSPASVERELIEHLGNQSGLFGPAAAYAFIVGYIGQLSPDAVHNAIEAHKRSQARVK